MMQQFAARLSEVPQTLLAIAHNSLINSGHFSQLSDIGCQHVCVSL